MPICGESVRVSLLIYISLILKSLSNPFFLISTEQLVESVMLNEASGAWQHPPIRWGNHCAKPN